MTCICIKFYFQGILTVKHKKASFFDLNREGYQPGSQLDHKVQLDPEYS